MKYNKVTIHCSPCSEAVTDVLAAQLAEIGYDSFVPSSEGLEAYVPQHVYSAADLEQLFATFLIDDVQFDYVCEPLEDKNWNEEWEKNYFQPIIVSDECIIHSSFHHPEGEYTYRILIDPKMAFGTGHHQTTGLILREILNIDFAGKSVLDMGCGTAVLAILAAMKGASPVVGIDIDEWAYNNAVENVELNNVANIQLACGGAELLGKDTFDVIFANINRNILLQDMHHYMSVLNPKGTLIMSGFYTEDIPVLQQKAESLGLTFSHSNSKDNWATLICVKP